MEVIVIDDFLPYNDFKNLQNFVMDSDLSWFFNPVLNTGHDTTDYTCYFTHALFNMKKSYIFSEFYHMFGPLFYEKLEIKSLIRMKLNLYSYTETTQKHALHRDYPFPHKGCLFSFNTCNGATHFQDGTSIDSVENRAILFDAYELHGSTSCSDAKARINLNVNYF